MTKNVGSVDRIVRLVLGVILAVLVLVGAVSGALAIILGIVAVILIVTGALSVCPLYMLLGISTLKK